MINMVWGFEENICGWRKRQAQHCLCYASMAFLFGCSMNKGFGCPLSNSFTFNKLASVLEA